MDLQEVQKQGNRYKTPNDIEGIGYVERRLSYKTQIRDKEGAGGNIQYAEIALSYNGTISQNDYQNFNDMTITGDSFVSIDPNYSNRILIEPGVYFAYVHIDVWNVSRVFYTSMRYFYSDGVLGPTIIDVENSTEQMSISTIFEATTTTGYLRIGIRPENGNVNSFNGDILKLMKMR